MENSKIKWMRTEGSPMDWKCACLCHLANIDIDFANKNGGFAFLHQRKTGVCSFGNDTLQ